MERELVAAALLLLVAAAAVAFRRRSGRDPRRVDPADFGGRSVVVFTSPYCLACQRWQDALTQSGIDASYISVRDRPDLARKYGVSATPLVLRLDGEKVVRSWHGDPQPGHLAEIH